MPDMSALLAQAQQMQEQLLSAKAELDAAQVEGSAANGLVSATVTGAGEVVGVTIKPEAVDPDDTETLGDMVVAAIRDARAQADAMAAERLGPLAGGGGEGGMGDLGSLFGGGGDDTPGLPGGSGDRDGGRPGPIGFG
ncbi:YbaB/EbfC family nucleoid-associated protein [Solicola sp. PLA-1-18]|uniref:YbaB/EbfC family nucleoid-associated protein n=1 Tax=Solicola sp. PLA-1-18 TaxID=3380532 RepID=UPI003B77DAF0